MTLSADSPWIYEHLIDLTKGMNISLRPELLDKGELVNAQNVWFEDGRVNSDTGFKTLLNTVRGAPRVQFQFFKTTGSSENLLITNDTIYTETNNAWHYIHDGNAILASTTVIVAGVVTDLTIEVLSITGFDDGDFIEIELDTGTQHQTIIDGAPSGSTITFIDALPSDVSIDNLVVKAVLAIPTVTTAGIFGDLTIEVSSANPIADGNFIGIELDDGTQHQTTVNGAPGSNTITFIDALPSSAAVGNLVVKAVDLTGVNTDQVSVTVLAAFDYFIFTNGQDNVMYYDGLIVQDVPNMPSSGDCKCKVVAIFNFMLLLIHTIEGGTAYPQRIRNSDVADISEWVNGIAGYIDLFDSEDFLTAALLLGPYMMLYKERTVIRMEYIGDTVTPRIFNFDVVVTGEGARSVDSVIDIGTEHILIGNANVYRYRGGFDIEPVADKVWSKLFGNSAELNPNLGGVVSIIYIEELDEAWFFYADSEATAFSNNIARLKLSSNAWSFRSLPIEISGYGFFSTNDTLKWSELVGSWLAQTFKWGGSQTQAGSPTTILLSNTTVNQAYEYDYVNDTDNDIAIAWLFETKELYNPDEKFRTNFMDLRGKGGTVLIEYSLDGGINWDTWVDTILGASYEEYRYHKQVISNRIRFRLSGTSSGFSLAWLGIQFMPESSH